MLRMVKSRMGLVNKLVDQWYVPKCSNCALFSTCKDEPKHFAYPTEKWIWVKHAKVAFRTREGDLVLSEGELEFLNRHKDARGIVPGCTHYTVHKKHIRFPMPHHRQYIGYAKLLTKLNTIWRSRKKGAQREKAKIENGSILSPDKVKEMMFELQMENL